MKRTRAERRHHHQRMIDKTRKFVCENGMKEWFSLTDFEKRIRQLAENRKPCSCWMCGNPRKAFKDNLTMQEKKFEEYAKGDE